MDIFEKKKNDKNNDYHGGKHSKDNHNEPTHDHFKSVSNDIDQIIGGLSDSSKENQRNAGESTNKPTQDPTMDSSNENTIEQKEEPSNQFEQKDQQQENIHEKEEIFEINQINNDNTNQDNTSQPDINQDPYQGEDINFQTDPIPIDNQKEMSEQENQHNKGFSENVTSSQTQKESHKKGLFGKKILKTKQKTSTQEQTKNKTKNKKPGKKPVTLFSKKKKPEPPKMHHGETTSQATHEGNTTPTNVHHDQYDDMTINNDVLRLLEITDELLGKLPEDVISEFASSDDFDLYKKVMNKYNIGK